VNTKESLANTVATPITAPLQPDFVMPQVGTAPWLNFETIMPTSIGRVFVQGTPQENWVLAGGCWAISDHLVVANYHLVFEMQRFNRKTNKPLLPNSRVQPQNVTRKWKPLAVMVLTKTGKSIATVRSGSRALDYVTLACPHIAFTPLPWTTTLPRPANILLAHYPLVIDLNEQERKTFSIAERASALSWAVITSFGQVVGERGNLAFSNYVAFPGSCGFPVVVWCQNQWKVCGIHAEALHFTVNSNLTGKDTAVQAPTTSVTVTATSSPSSAGTHKAGNAHLRKLSFSETSESEAEVVVELGDAEHKGAMASFILMLGISLEEAKFAAP